LPQRERRNREQEERWYSRERYKPADRDAAEANGDGIANGKTASQASREAGKSNEPLSLPQRISRGLDLDQAKRLRELDKENAKLKRLVVNWLEKQILKDVAEGNL